MVQMTTPEPVLGRHAHDFRLMDVDGRHRTLADVRGERGLVVMFICNHCPYVRAIRERLVDDCRELMAEGIGVVAINANDPHATPEDSPQRMREIAVEWELPFPYLFDDAQDVARAYGAVCTPDFFGYAADLTLQYRGRLDGAHMGPRAEDTPRDLVDAMREIARTGMGPVRQWPSIGCSIKWARARMRA